MNSTEANHWRVKEVLGQSDGWIDLCVCAAPLFLFACNEFVSVFCAASFLRTHLTHTLIMGT